MTAHLHVQELLEVEDLLQPTDICFHQSLAYSVSFWLECPCISLMRSNATLIISKHFEHVMAGDCVLCKEISSMYHAYISILVYLLWPRPRPVNDSCCFSSPCYCTSCYAAIASLTAIVVCLHPLTHCQMLPCRTPWQCQDQQWTS